MDFKYKITFTITFVFVLTGCYIYQKPKLYTESYKIGENQNLRFDGYYRIDTTRSASLYFYPDGTVITVDKGVSQSTIEDEMSKGYLYGEYGVYSVSGDTLKIEDWQANSESESPIIYKHSILQTAIIDFNEIKFTEVYRNGRNYVFAKPFVYEFNESSIKPKLYPNWIKEKKKWNK